MQLTPELLERLRSIPRDSSLTFASMEPCLCGKVVDVAECTQRWHSGRFAAGRQLSPGINYTDLLCADCRKEFAGMPRIVCLGCRSLMGFYKPGRQSTGFEFERNRHYHIAECPRCNPEVRSTPVIEHEDFCRANRVETVVANDLLQEIEQKRLQAEVEAARLREEFNSTRKT